MATLTEGRHREIPDNKPAISRSYDVAANVEIFEGSIVVQNIATSLCQNGSFAAPVAGLAFVGICNEYFAPVVAPIAGKDQVSVRLKQWEILDYPSVASVAMDRVVTFVDDTEVVLGGLLVPENIVGVIREILVDKVTVEITGAMNDVT